MRGIRPCLWFDQNAQEAAEFYTGIFPDSEITTMSYYGDGGPMPAGLPLVVAFTLRGQPMMALNGGPVFTFSEAISLSVDCESQEEVDYYWEKLLEGGAPQQCGWLKDKFGLSWQVVPLQIEEMMGDPDKEKVQRVTQAMLQMVKLDIATLERAYVGA